MNPPFGDDGAPSTTDLPFHVRRWRRHPLWLVVPLTALAISLVVADYLQSRASAERPVGTTRTTATVITTDPETHSVVGRYTDPTRGPIEVWLTGDAPLGTSVDIDMDTRNPSATDTVDALALRVPWNWNQLLVYLMWLLPPWLWWASRWFTVRRARKSIAASGSQRYRMVGVVGRVPGRRRPALLLYPLDARVGDRPVAGVPLVPGSELVLGERLVVDVVGIPSPGAFVIPLTEAGALGGAVEVIWPAGRAVMRATVPWSDDAAHWCSGQPSRWPLVVAALLGAGLITSAVVYDVGEHQEYRRIAGNDLEVEATVTGVSDEYEYDVLYRVPDQEGVQRAAGIYESSADDIPPEVGDRIRVLIDPELPTAYLATDQPDWFATIFSVVTALVVMGIVWLVCVIRRPSIDGLASSPRIAVGADDPSRWFRRLDVSRVPGLSVRLSGGLLVARGGLHLCPTRWQLAFRSEGMELKDGRGGHAVVGWDEPWRFDRGFGRDGPIQLRVAGPDGRVFTLTGTGRWHESEAERLALYVRDHRAARIALEDPERCTEVAATLAIGGHWRPAIRHRDLDARIRRSTMSAGRVSTDELTDRVWTEMSEQDRRRATRGWVTHRVRYWKGRRGFEFEPLSAEPPRPHEHPRSA